MTGPPQDGSDADAGLAEPGPARRAATRRPWRRWRSPWRGRARDRRRRHGVDRRLDGGGVAANLAISLVFLEVGLSEDRARAREQRPAAGRPPPGAADPARPAAATGAARAIARAGTGSRSRAP